MDLLMHVHVLPDRGGGFSGRGDTGARRENVPGVDGRHGDGRGPEVVHGRAGQQGRRRAEVLDDARRRRNKRLHEVHEIVPDLVALAAKKLAGAILFETLEGCDVGAENELVDGLHKVVVQLLALLFLSRPVGRVRLGVDAVNLLVVLNKGVDGVDGELVGDLVAVDHVDVDNVGLNVDELVAEHVLGVVGGHVGLGELGQHDGSERPDGILVGEGLGEASLVLGHRVERALNTVDALERQGQPRLDLGAEDDIDGG